MFLLVISDKTGAVVRSYGGETDLRPASCLRVSDSSSRPSRGLLHIRQSRMLGFKAKKRPYFQNDSVRVPGIPESVKHDWRRFVTIR